VVVILRLEAHMVILKAAVVELWLASVTFATKLLLPDPVGVPLICPLLLRVRPAGKLPELSDHVYGNVPPLAISVAKYGKF
jgi:hypothetical protein